MREITALKEKKADLLNQAQGAIDAKDMEKARNLRDQAKALADEIALREELYAEGARNASPASAGASSATDGDIRASREYSQAFFSALKKGLTTNTARGMQEYEILYNALSETGGATPGEDGGFLLPVDFDEKLHELRRARIDLSTLITVESVSTVTGWRVMETAKSMAKLMTFKEMDVIPEGATPQFRRIDYACKEYGNILPMSNLLLEDAPVNIMAYVAKWFARMSVNTDNEKIIALLNTLTGTAFDLTKHLGSLKTALNKKLDPAFSRSAIILTNQDGFDALDQLEDATGRPLLKPDVVDATLYRALGRKVICAPNADLPTVGGKAPVYVGSFKDYATLFRRKGFELAVTTIGAGAFERNMTKMRGIMRFDLQKFDAEAVTKLEITL